ncbi:MAG: EF-P lysine aminoacylase EpmA [Planctomycetota bacterium]
MKSESLRQRAELLAQLRAFFRERGFLGVETPLAAREVIPEEHIEPIALADGERFLQASPEMHHKRLLCAGVGPIYEVTRSFRGFEHGRLHRPEFTIVEWYRPGDDMHAGMDLLDELMRRLLGTPAAERTTYREAFARTVAIDPHTASLEELRSAAQRLATQQTTTQPPTELQAAAAPPELPSRDEALNFLLSFAVEPTLGREAPEIVHHYPASQAALATVATHDGVEVAERFELYYRGVELANGYHELTDAVELRRRLNGVNALRAAAGKPTLPLPESLLDAMTEPGLPPCAGVALGFDRLVMLATGADHIADVVAFSED